MCSTLKFILNGVVSKAFSAKILLKNVISCSCPHHSCVIKNYDSSFVIFCDRLQPIKPKSAVTAAGSSSKPAAPRAPQQQQQQQQAADMIDIEINDDVTESRPSTALSDFSAVTELNDSNQTGRYYIPTIQL